MKFSEKVGRKLKKFGKSWNIRIALIDLVIRSFARMNVSINQCTGMLHHNDSEVIMHLDNKDLWYTYGLNIFIVMT